jgi:dTMP kinase
MPRRARLGIPQHLLENEGLRAAGFNRKNEWPPVTGLFITLEGGEGTGKTTQARALREHLEERGLRVTVTHEPQGTELGRRLWRHIAKGGLSPEAEFFLFLAARTQHVAEVIRPALERGEVVICDRFTDSTLAYQGYGRGLDLATLERLNEVAAQGLKPDFTVLLDLPVKKGLARARDRTPSQARAKAPRPAAQPPARFRRAQSSRSVEPDSIGSETEDFHERVRRGYLALAAREPGRWLVADATLPWSDTSDYILRHLERFLPGSGGSR